ncbi:PorP/SprF family type IX secretion system membrane protein [Pontibacter silvestris]|uniref:PorP/SprF family type IX secretion system membrane protein n=1 Tax=Pontibacter silvestris TaxID=2305183 RepID=A0ABW4X316_9BACT|nr:PorP/SprF family type IX secretion system membrane protein [Pontibacter silvestris]MCC9135897.1 PorP/SprF family type IX secretion system membrane protein [Pontibacter silvestris]
MKKYIIAIAAIISALGAQAQSRKHIANFSLFQQYYNPALTGYEGSMVKTFYRNQWSGFEDAPKTVFASGELDLADLSAWKNDGQLKTREEGSYDRQAGARHAFGLAVLHDEFGPFTESQIQLGYGSRVRLSETVSLRWGSALAYSTQLLDGNRLTVDEKNDPQYLGTLGNSSRFSKLDLNLGLMLTADKFYFGYAVQDIMKGGLVTSGDDFMKDTYTRKHIVQAGYRTVVSEQVGLVVNGICQYDNKLGETVEGQVKAVYQNMFWVGGGYRKDLAYTVNAGLRLNQLKVGYVYEMPTGDAGSINQNTNEIMLTYNLVAIKFPKFGRSVTIW